MKSQKKSSGQSRFRAPVIALTGSIGSGKSVAADMLASLGATVIDADKIAREVVEPGTPGLEAVVKEFGANFLTSEGNLNRKALGQLIFSDEEKRRKLQAVLHPLIRQRVKDRIRALRSSQTAPVVYVVPLLFETRASDEDVDQIVVVSAPKETSIERIMTRDSLSREEALKRYQSQLPIEEKEQKADIVIHNNGTLEKLESQILDLYRQLTVQ